MPNYAIPSDAHSIGDAGHTIDHNSIADMLNLLLAQGGAAQAVTGFHVGTSLLPRPAVYGAAGLRRWRAAAGDALFSPIPVVVVGDSIAAGQGGDNNVSTYSNVPDNTQGWAGQLRTMFGTALGSSPGEGFWFATDSRITTAGSPVNNNYACGPLRTCYRLLHGASQSLSLTVPAGVTAVTVIQANQTQAFNSAGTNLADVSALYSQTGSHTVTNAAITTLTNTGRAIGTDIACAAADTITVSNPATAQSYIAGFIMKTGSAGVLVHRVGQPGYVSGDLLGGQTSGTLLNTGNSTLLTDAARAVYDWAGTTGLIICGFGTNDQQYQAGGGSANQNDVTLSLYTTWMEQFTGQAVADGWAVLILGQPRNPNAASSGSTQDQYWAAMQAYALATDHVAFADVGELWGTNSASTALNLTSGTSVHPNRRGHGDLARMVFQAVTGVAGTAELTAA
jgi:lysophospholipase L1-like esterase